MKAMPQRRIPLMSNNAPARDVIVADNDYIIRGILRSVLEGQNFNVLQAVDGIEAIDLAMRTNARLVILDYKMPKLDGFAACMQIRRLPGYTDVPIVVLTRSTTIIRGERHSAQGPPCSWPNHSDRSICCRPLPFYWALAKPTPVRHQPRARLPHLSGNAARIRHRSMASRQSCPKVVGF
jgi:CheY-like chemotaxis protein